MWVLKKMDMDVYKLWRILVQVQEDPGHLISAY